MAILFLAACGSQESGPDLSARELAGLSATSPDPDNSLYAAETDEGEEVWGEGANYDGDMGDDTEKTKIAELHGWSLKGALSTATSGPHKGGIVPLLTTIGDFASFDRDFNRGRCGRFDGLVDNAFYPCAVPRSDAGHTTWTIRFDPANCTDASAQQLQDIRGGIDALTSNLAVLTNQKWILQNTTSTNQNILVRCASSSQAQLMPNTVAAGHPTGLLTFSHAGPSSLSDICEDATAAGSVEPETGAQFFAATNEFYWYDHGEITINWFKWRSFYNTDCSSIAEGPAKRSRFAKFLIMHEGAHVFGFQHQSDRNDPVNIMNPSRSCARFNGNGNWRVRMYDTMKDIDLPHTSVALQAFDEDLACYSPL